MRLLRSCSPRSRHSLQWEHLPASSSCRPFPRCTSVAGHHGLSFTITRYEFAPEGRSAIAQWRTYTPCVDTTGLTTKRNSPPCDSILANFIEPGGLASVALMHPEGQNDRKLTGLVHATTDQKGMFGKWGASIELTMLPGNMLLAVVC
jgi:hypothetical protein